MGLGTVSSGEGNPGFWARRPTRLDAALAYTMVPLTFAPYVAVNFGNSTSIPIACLLSLGLIARTLWDRFVFWATLILCGAPFLATVFRLLVAPHPLSVAPYLTWICYVSVAPAMVSIFLVLRTRVLPLLSITIAVSALIGHIQKPFLEAGTIPWLWYYQARGVTPVTELANRYNPRPFGLFPEPSYLAGTLTLSLLLVAAIVQFWGITYSWREWLAFVLVIPLLLDTVSGSLVVTLAVLVAAWCIPLVRRLPALLGLFPVATLGALIKANDVLAQRSTGAFNFSWVDRSSSLIIGLRELVSGPAQTALGIGRGMTTIYFTSGRMPTYVAMHYNSIPDVYSVTLRVIIENGLFFGTLIIVGLAWQFLRNSGLGNAIIGLGFLVCWLVVAGLTVTYDGSSWCWAAPGGMAGLAHLRSVLREKHHASPQRAHGHPPAHQSERTDARSASARTRGATAEGMWWRRFAPGRQAEAPPSEPVRGPGEAVASPDAAGSKSRLRRNILWNYLSGLSSMLGLVLLFPFAVRLGGAHAYGLWLLVFGATLLVSFADFGMGDGIVRSLTRLMRGGATEQELRSFVSVAMTVFAGLTVGLLVLFLVGLPLYLRSVDTAGISPSTLRFMVTAGTLALAGTLIGRAYNAVLWALDRQDIERKASVIGMGVRAAGYMVTGATGAGITGIVVAEVVGLCVAPAVCVYSVARRFGGPKLDVEGFRKHAAELLQLGATLFVGSMAAILTFQVPLYVVGSLLGLTAATSFAALMRIYQSAKLVNSWMANPFIHRISTTSGDALVRSTEQAFVATITVAMAMLVGLVGLAPAIMEVWLGQNFRGLHLAASLIGLGIMADALIQPSILVISLRGRPRTVATLNVVGFLVVMASVALALRAESLEWVMFAATAPLAAMAPRYLREAVRVVGGATRGGTRPRWPLVEIVLGACVSVAALRLMTQLLPPLATVILGGAAVALELLGIARWIRARSETPG